MLLRRVNGAENEVGGTCSTHRRVANAYTAWSHRLKERGRLKDLYAHMRIILKWILKEEGVD